MNIIENVTSYASLFKRFRLQSGIATLAEFGDLLAESGFIYETSLFSHWQKNERIPKDRKLVLAILHIFVTRRGIRTIEEANDLLTTLDMRDLSHAEWTNLGLKPAAMMYDPEDNPPLQTILSDLIRKIVRIRFFIFLTAFFVAITIWYVRISVFHRTDTMEAYVFNWVYGFIALGGATYGFSRKNKHAYINLLSLGLISEFFGVQVWFYYNLRGINVPFPSIADIGYMSVIPIYTIAALKFYESSTHRTWRFLDRRGLYMLVPLLVAFIGWSVVLVAMGVDMSRQAKFILDFVHPFGETVPVLIVGHMLLFAQPSVSNKVRLVGFMLIAAWSAQFMTDYTFLYSEQTNKYVNAGFVDYMYILSYMTMNLVVLSGTALEGK